MLSAPMAAFISAFKWISLVLERGRVTKYVGEYQNKVKQKISIFFGNTPPVRSTPVFKKF